jgi:hypothetical protein
LLVDVAEQTFNISMQKYIELGLPSYIIFVKGQPLYAAAGNIINMRGINRINEVVSFIYKHVSADLIATIRQATGVLGASYKHYGSAQDDQFDPYVPDFFWGSFWGPAYP